MSLVGLEEVVSVNREDLEAAGVRGLDLDFLSDSRVDHQLAMRALEEVVAKELARWRQVVSSVTSNQWAYFYAIGEDNRETRARNKARRELVEAFKRRVLVFYKEACKRKMSDA